MIHAPHNDDESPAHLVHTVKNFISVERDRKSDLFEDEKVIRKGGSHPSFTLAASVENRMRIQSQEGAPLIEHENIIRKWSPSSEIKELGSKLSSQLLCRVGSLCGCRIEQASDSAHFLIKADTELDVEKGTLKLERLNKMMVSLFPLSIGFEPLLLGSPTAPTLCELTSQGRRDTLPTNPQLLHPRRRNVSDLATHGFERPGR